MTQVPPVTSFFQCNSEFQVPFSALFLLFLCEAMTMFVCSSTSILDFLFTAFPNIPSFPLDDPLHA